MNKILHIGKPYLEIDKNRHVVRLCAKLDIQGINSVLTGFKALLMNWKSRWFVWIPVPMNF